MSDTSPPVAWRISTKSASNGGSCVEAGPVLDGSGRVAVRHSRAPDAAVIVDHFRQAAAFRRLGVLAHVGQREKRAGVAAGERLAHHGDERLVRPGRADRCTDKRGAHHRPAG